MLGRLYPFARIPTIGIVLLLILNRNGSAQTLGPLDRGRGRDMLHLLRKDMERYYYDSTFRGMDLAPRWAEAEQRIRQASTLEQILVAIAQVPIALGDSHIDDLVLPTAEDLATGRDPALARSLALAGVLVSPERAGRMFPRR